MTSTVVRPTSESFVIEGGHAISGRVRASGNKNGALPILASCLLTDAEVQLANVPRIRDVETMMALLAALGADVEWTGPNDVRVHAHDVGYEVDEELWRVAALLHDFDYEIHPTLDKHPQDGAPILREEGYPEEVVETVLSHANHLGLPRDTLLKKALFACDELSGFVHACGLVRPTGLEGLEPKSVKKKLKQPSFASGVSREDVYEGAELLELDLDEHIANVVAALQPIAGELGLRTG